MPDTVVYPQPFYRGQMVLHVKTGGLYRIVMSPLSGLRIASSNDPAYAYQRARMMGNRVRESPIWVRSAAIMEDGRFVAYDLPKRLKPLK